jgi:hypothetical protein
MEKGNDNFANDPGTEYFLKEFRPNRAAARRFLGFNQVCLKKIFGVMRHSANGNLIPICRPLEWNHFLSSRIQFLRAGVFQINSHVRLAFRGVRICSG